MVVLVEVGRGLAGDLLHDILGQIVVRDVCTDVPAERVLGGQPELGEAFLWRIGLWLMVRQARGPYAIKDENTKKGCNALSS